MTVSFDVKKNVLDVRAQGVDGYPLPPRAAYLTPSVRLGWSKEMRVGALASLVALLGLTGCPSFGVVCQPGTVACGTGCIDPNADARNCGGCGLACGNNEDCNSGTCQCQAGTTSCNGTCVVLSDDARNCGSCGNVCDGGACEESLCRPACTLGTSIPCDGSCVDSNNDPRHCGGCNSPCAQGQACHGGICI